MFAVSVGVAPARRVVLIAVVMAVVCLLAFMQSPAGAQGPSSVSLSSAESTVTVPDSIHLTASTDASLTGSGRRIVIYDDDTGGSLAICTGGTTCTATPTNAWSNNVTRTRRFHADLVVSSTGAVVASSAQVSVQVVKYDFGLTISAAANSVTVPDTTSVTARINRDISGTGNWFRVYDADNGASLAICTSGTTCTGQITTSWSNNISPAPRNIRAEDYRSSNSSIKEAVSEPVTVHIRPYRFSVTVTPGARETVTGGGVRYPISASTTRTVSSTGYRLIIWRVLPSGSVTSAAICTAGTTCGPAYANAGERVYATVQDTSNRVYGKSHEWLLDADRANKMEANGVNAAALAATFATAHELCDVLLVAPPSMQHHTLGSSVSDEQMACNTSAQAGQATVQAMAAVLAAGGGVVLAWIAVNEHRKDSGWQPPQPGDPPPTDQPPVPTPLSPETFRRPDLASTIASKNDLTLTNAEIDTLTDHCIARMLDAGHHSDLCGMLPIFVSGYDVQEAAAHDLSAIYRTPDPAPILLNAAPGKPHVRWYQFDSRCAGSSTATPCDEYPFQSTEQGFPTLQPPVSLKVISQLHNSRQGGNLGAFYTKCAMKAGAPDDRFIALPIPGPTPSIPSINNLCNGKTT